MQNWCGILLSLPLPCGVAICGGWFLIKTRGLLKHPKTLLRLIFGSGKESRKALALALAGTLGIGNIAGVASAVSLGGPGAVFWMLLSSFAAMLLKYAETVCAMLHRKRDGAGWHGGAMYYLPRWAAILFSLLCLACSFTVGNGMQVSAAASVTREVTGANGLWAGIIMAGLLLLVLLTGKRRLFDLAAALVPFMTAGYLLLCLAVLVKKGSALPGVLREIAVCAFCPKAVVGGTVGYTLFGAIRYGFTRGLVSNEAGCGTAPIAHAGNGESPVRQGCMGIAEVFIDTTLLCSLTALTVLLSAAPRPGEEDGMAIVLRGFRAALGEGAGWLLLPAVFLFGFAAAVCWSYYGSECIHYLCPDPAKEKTVCRLYCFLYAIAALPFAILPAGAIFAATDFLLTVMTLLHLFFLLRRRREILHETHIAGLG